MRGAIAAGHPLTADAGARVLEAGGNAVDACVAASFASWVTESPLTGPGGGGFMLVHSSRDRSETLLDFFTAVPGLGLQTGSAGAMDAVDVDFSGDSIQVFKVGPASVAVPGAALGLEEAHRRWGSLPWPELMAPAAELARTGVELTRPQAYLHAILDVILRHSSEGRALYGEAERLVAGDVLRLPELADTMELLGERGAGELYTGDLGHAMCAHVAAGGGALTRRDLEEFRVVEREPVRAAYRGHEFCSNPPPSSGGSLVAYALRLLDRLGEPAPFGSAEAIGRMADVMREVAGAREGLPLYEDGSAARVLAAAEDDAYARIQSARSTTHISVVDGDGNAAALTISTGAGSGVVVPGTGVQLNNMLGEFDLPQPPAPGERLSSMMSPSIVARDGRPRLVVGSAGSLRLRSAVLQTVVNVIGHGLEVEDAIDRPRVHYEPPHLHCEGGTDPVAIDRLVEWGNEVVRWRRRNLYFGGVSAVEMLDDGELRAAGDPRRGGHGIVVE
jgi:gamma-glutamyltranspeptidase/glutathione hydrolase